MGSVAYRSLAQPEGCTSSDRDHHSTWAAGEHPRECEVIQPSRLVRAVQAARQRRVALFDDDLFSDPAWDILLELYALYLEQRRASVSALYSASSVPGSTALRWISKLERDGLVKRVDDLLDARRSWIELTADGHERMRRFFEMLPLAIASV